MKWLERVLHGIGVFFEERTEGFQIWEIDIGQEATQARSMGQTSAFKQSHEGRFERLYALKEVGKSPFSTDSIPYQRPEKIDGFIAAEAPSHQANPARAKASSSPFVAR